ncbi:MAG: AAA family ATPase [Calditrichaeota bacterium]|nr:MAG: AAA family ATPase [Calditrichota bacterium]
MQRFQLILLQVWQEACRHIEIFRSCSAISELLLPHLPVEQVLICVYDAERSYLETIAVGLSPGRQLPAGQAPMPAKLWQTLAKRFETAPLFHCSEKDANDLMLLTDDAAAADTLIGRLGAPHQISGLLIIIAREGQYFNQQHRNMMEALLDPFTVALENDRRIRELAALRETAEAEKKSLMQRFYRQSLENPVVGAEHGLAVVMERVELVARSDVPVLILGETGTGKELIAREIHRRSARAEGPFIRVNCGAIPPELIDSQLFGHEKGAFTGAVASHQGWFERAHTGTLFLDEIGELSQAGQVRLLRIIQDGWLERVSARQPIHVDVRVVVATHRDLAEMVRRGLFREDLWYRLAVFPILLPALRDRTEDIPALANHFAERAAIRFGLPPQMLSAGDIELLKHYHWPGNIRELGSVIDRAALIGNGAGLEIGKALGFLDDDRVKMNDKSFKTDGSAMLPLDEAIRRYIIAVLQRCEGRVEGPRGAATLLRVQPNTLRARMRKLKINWTDYRPQP